MKIKVFCAAAGELEGQVNEWLGEMTPTNKIEIINMFQGVCTVKDTIYVTVTYIYREKVAEAAGGVPAKYA